MTRPRKNPAGIFRSRGGRLNHQANEAVYVSGIVDKSSCSFYVILRTKLRSLQAEGNNSRILQWVCLRSMVLVSTHRFTLRVVGGGGAGAGGCGGGWLVGWLSNSAPATCSCISGADLPSVAVLNSHRSTRPG